MLARYRIVRGKRDPKDPLPAGRRLDVRKHTHHVLAPDAKDVEAFLENPTERAARQFTTAYRSLLERRFAEDRAPFDALARDASESDVYIGCNCPTRLNPDVSHCHTFMALKFMKKKYPKLRVVMPR